MRWDEIRTRLRRLVGKNLSSISGKADITITSVDERYITIRGTNAARRGAQRLPVAKLKELASAMKLNKSLHVETFVHGSGSTRQRSETIMANMPDVEWKKIENRKHIVWVGRKTHRLGTLKPERE